MTGQFVFSRRLYSAATRFLESETGLTALQGTYTSPEQFIRDMLAFQDRVLQVQPNAANGVDDCQLQMAHLVLLRALTPQLVDFNTPFVFQFTDLHASNLFVDEAWNVTGVIDLEFMCSLPSSMLNVPYWLAGEYLDDIPVERHESVHNAFMEAFRREEAGRCTLSRIIQESWDSGEYWLYHCLTSINVLPNIVKDHLWGLFGFCRSLQELDMFTDWLSLFWSRRSRDAFVAGKLAEKKAYAGEVRQYFANTA